MFRHFIRFVSLRTLTNLTKCNTKITTGCSKRPKYFKTGSYCGFAIINGLGRVYAKSEEGADDLIENFEEEIKRATVQGEKYLAQLMRVLRTLILQTSIEYQECLIKQIEITEESTKIGPVGEHWDRLTSVRVQGKELKEELGKYEALAANIAEIVRQEVQSSLDIGNQIILEQLNNELEKLQKLCKEQLQEIHRYETLLLAANRNSIVHGVRSK